MFLGYLLFKASIFLPKDVLVLMPNLRFLPENLNASIPAVVEAVVVTAAVDQLLQVQHVMALQQLPQDQLRPCAACNVHRVTGL